MKIEYLTDREGRQYGYITTYNNEDYKFIKELRKEWDILFMISMKEICDANCVEKEQ